MKRREPHGDQDSKLHQVWQSHPELHSRYTFQEAMAVRALAICLRNEAYPKGGKNGG